MLLYYNIVTYIIGGTVFRYCRGDIIMHVDYRHIVFAIVLFFSSSFFPPCFILFCERHGRNRITSTVDGTVRSDKCPKRGHGPMLSTIHAVQRGQLELL